MYIYSKASLTVYIYIYIHLKWSNGRSILYGFTYKLHVGRYSLKYTYKFHEGKYKLIQMSHSVTSVYLTIACHSLTLSVPIPVYPSPTPISFCSPRTYSHTHLWFNTLTPPSHSAHLLKATDSDSFEVGVAE